MARLTHRGQFAGRIGDEANGKTTRPKTTKERKLNSILLVNALRAKAQAMIDAEPDADPKRHQENRDAAELILTLAHIVNGKPVSVAFGAPGDWGYGTPIGDALAAKHVGASQPTV